MKSIIITGATSGIGYECAIQIAKLAINEQIILACRNLKTGNKTIETIKHKTGHKNIICLPLDLESLESIREFKKQVEKTGTTISTLINNAGLQNVDKTKYTKDGFEQTFGVNHLAPFYLTLLLIPYLAEDASITFTASGTHDPDQKSGMPAPEFKEAKLLAYPVETDETKIKVGQRRYATSKLCNILTTYELQRRLANTKIRVNAFDPGLVPGTGLARNYPPVLKFISDYVFKALILFVPNVNTAQNSGKRLANLSYNDKYKSSKGKYFEGEKEIKSSTDSYNKELQKILWESSIELLGVTQNETSISLT